MLRLTGGEFRGRTILTPPHEKTRPTSSKLRQALFNSLQGVISGAHVLDLFAGSGALGFEALSRGAERAVFVESHRPTARLLEKNVETLGVEQRVMIITESVDRFWARCKGVGPFDIVLADPPYSGGWEGRLLEELPWQDLLKEGGCFCLEWGLQKSRDFASKSLPDELPFLVKVREKNYGDSMLSTYSRRNAS